jgi:hypothetical protein
MMIQVYALYRALQMVKNFIFFLGFLGKLGKKPEAD